MTPHWERGYRVHGYWLGETRVGWVSRPPGRSVGALGYGWGYVNADGVTVEGRTSRLKQAKRLVEKGYQLYGQASKR